MKKIECETCKDLLTLYVDDVCSESSRQLVEEHMQSCDECREAYYAMKGEIEIPAVEKDEKDKTDEFKINLKKTWRRFWAKKAVMIGLASILGSAAIVFGVYMLFFHYYYVPASEIEIKNLCQLVDGRIAFQIVDQNREHSFKKYKFLSDVKGGEEGALYLVAENTLFDKPDYSQPCYADFSPVVEDDYETYNYDKVFYGLPDDKDRICIWRETGENYLNEASGPIAKYFYDGNFFYQYNKQGDVWKCEDHDFTITCDAVFQNWDTTAAVNLYEGKLGGFDLTGDVYKETSVYENLYDQTLSFLNTDDPDKKPYVTGKYTMVDQNTMLLTLTEDMSQLSGYSGKTGNKLVFHRSEKKGKLGYYGKLNIIDRFAAYSFYIPEKDIKEFYYKLDDKQLLFATKIEVNVDEMSEENKMYAEEMIKGNEFDKFGPSKKYYDIGIDWWQLSDDKVVTSGDLYTGSCSDLMADNGEEYYYITKENGKYYYYAFCKFDRLSYDEVSEMYKSLYDTEFVNYDTARK